jgi:hypothetical protein
MGEPERFFFVHLQKTGGTALYQRLRESFGPSAVYPTPEDQGEVAAVLDVDRMVQRFATQRDQVRVVTGHFPLCAAERLGVPFATFTVLRDPVERTLSLLRRRQAADARFQGLELDAIYDDAELRIIIDNHMVKMLSLTSAAMGPTPLTQPLALDATHLERARQNLEGIDVVGFQEHFEDFCTALEARFGWDLGPPRFANRTVPQPVPDALRERIASANHLDAELYRFALRSRRERPV